MSRDELEGFILSNSKRRQIVSALEGEEFLDVDAIAKKKRIPKRFVKELLNDLKEKELVIEEKDGYKLSDLGNKIVADSHKFDSG